MQHTDQTDGPDAPNEGDAASDYYMQRRRIATWMVLLGVGAILLVFGFFLTRSGTTGVTYERVTFNTQGFDQKPVTLSGLLIKPAGFKGQAPGVIFANGFTGCKEWYIQMTRQLAREGLVVLSYDQRGHGRSGGSCNFGCDEANDMLAAARWLKESGLTDGHVTAMGHSLGGVTATRAGIVQPDNSITSVVAIWCWTSLRDVMTDMSGPLDSFAGRSWFVTTYSRSVDINAADNDAKYRVEHMVTGSKPPNYMLAIGSNDELTSVEREEQLMEHATVDARKSGPEPKVKADVTYGSFADGTARKLVVTNDDHATELMSGSITRRAIDWIKQAAGMQPETRPTPFLMTRILGFVVLALGIMFIAMGTMTVARKRLFGEDSGIEVEPVWNGQVKRPGLDVLLYAVPVILTAFLSIPASKAFGIKPFIPYMFVNENSIFNLSRVILLLPFFVAFVVIVAKRARAAGKLQDDMRTGLRRWGRSALYALMPVAITVLLLMIIGGPLILPRIFPQMPIYFIIGVIIIGGAFWMEDYLFYKLAWPVLKMGDGSGAQWKALAVRGVVLDLMLIAAFLPLMKGPGVTVKLMAFSVPLLLLIIFATPWLMVLAKMSMRLRALTAGSLAFALMFSSLIVWFMTTVVSSRG